MNKRHTIYFRFLYPVMALLIVSVSFALTLPVTSAQGANPWETPQGQACFERWITESMAKLNAYNGGAEFNGRKPWSINKYGVLEGRPGVGPTSSGAPDNFPQYNNNKYWYMWDAWAPANADGTWRYPEWNGAGIENIRTFVTRCAPAAQATTVPGGGGGSSNPPIAATWTTNPAAQRGRNGERFTFICPPGGTPASVWGTDLYTDDSSVCAAAVHAGLITFASGGTVTIEIRPGASSYTGSARNGVTSGNWGSFAGSFAFVGGQPSTCDWTGIWNRQGEIFSWTQNGNQVTGTGISDSSWRLTGAVEGNVLTGKWSNSKDNGSVRIVISADCNSFDSSWGLGDNSSTFTGHGVRTGAPTGQYTLRTDKDTYAPNEKLIVQYAGLPNTPGNWIAIAKKGDADSSYGQWTFTGDKTSGSWEILAPPAGEYEARLYLNWPAGGYNVAARYPFRVQGAGTGAMTLEAPRRLALPNDLLLIPVTLRNAANVANLNFDVQYDANVIRPEGNLLKGNLLDNALFSGNPAQAGLIRNGFAQTSGLSGTGTVVNIPFRIVGKPGDKSPLNLTVTTINDPGGGALTIERIHGEIQITNSDGTLPPPPGGGGTPPPPGGGGIPRGDCDGDLRVTELDALCALEMSVQLRAIQLIMDMDNSGDVTSRDAVIILQRAVGQ